MPTKRTRTPGRTRQKPDHQTVCTVPDCGRPAYARGLCQTHHRQMLTLGRTRVIRPYRKRIAGTVKFAGLRLSPDCAGKIQRKAEREGISRGATIAEILEGWIEQTRSRKSARKPLTRPEH